MNFVSATDRLTTCPSHADIAREAGVSVQAVRQARMYPQAEGYRSPPAGWESAVARLARARAAELVKLADELEGRR
jgi:hypothetical protein